MEATARGWKSTSIGDDVVSFLWQHPLEHIHYVVVDTQFTTSDGSGTAGQADSGAEAQLDDLLISIYGAGNDDVGAKSVHVDGTDIPAKLIVDSLEDVEEGAPGFRPARQLKPAAYSSSLLEEAQSERPEHIEFRLLSCALDTLAQLLHKQDSEQLRKSLLDLYDLSLVEGDYRRAARVIASVKSLAGIESVRPLSDRWVEEAVSETRLRQVAASGIVGATKQVVEDLVVFFRACGRAAIPAILASYPAVEDPRLRRALSHLALQIGFEDLSAIRGLLTDPQAFVAQEALFLLSQVATPEAHALLQEAQQHPQPAVRIAFLSLAATFSSNEMIPIAAAMLLDPDAKVARAAANVLGTIKDDPRAMEALRVAAEADSFVSREAEVKDSILMNYSLLARSRALPLLATYIKKGEGRLVKSEVEDLAVAAVKSLRMVATPGAVQALRKAYAVSNRRVKETAKEVFTRMQEESKQ
ncbi:MAG: HEAT repeat domain-containing protein [Deltaproteobacteria bacterium]|nr:HEAT repeat domain-containing protein [Deltaproteobacteria bacterium]